MRVQTAVFLDIQFALATHFKAMSAKRLFSTSAEGDRLWDIYLSSFPPGSDPIYKVRSEHDCGCCRHFIKNLGGVVNVIDGKLVTLWDFPIEGPYRPVVERLAEYVRECVVTNVYLSPQKLVGTAVNRQLLPDGSVRTWDHFHANLPAGAVAKATEIGPKLSEFRATHDVMVRGLAEIAPDAIATVLELIAQNSLYRGEEHAFAVETFGKWQEAFAQVEDAVRDLLVWEIMDTIPMPVARIRNSVIGTLLVDLSEGKDLEDAVKSFEQKVAPTNYKRPTALVTKAMVAQAEKKVSELGLTTALERRYATLEDITVNNLLFADRYTRRALSVFEAIAADTAVDPKKLGKIEEVPIADFIQKVLPSAKSIEVLFENRHAGNLVSLVAPADPMAKPLFKWRNRFSWSYAGNLADSIKERVKLAGGSVTGDFRASLAWFNYDDLDLHLVIPSGREICYLERQDLVTGGSLDVDMNAGSGTSRTPVENITFPRRDRMKQGAYALFVQQYSKREAKDVGFEVELEFDGTVYNFAYAKPLKTKESVVVCRFEYSHMKGISILESLPSTQTSKTLWGLPTQVFHKVRAVMMSPNWWDGREIGNRHFFFMLDGCRNADTVRGFFNEFLDESLTPHRKVLEMVGARMHTEASEKQLSGVGFSSTQRNSLLCRVTGSFARVVKILF